MRCALNKREIQLVQVKVAIQAGQAGVAAHQQARQDHVEAEKARNFGFQIKFCSGEEKAKSFE